MPADDPAYTYLHRGVTVLNLTITDPWGLHTMYTYTLERHESVYTFSPRELITKRIKETIVCLYRQNNTVKLILCNYLLRSSFKEMHHW